MKTSEQMAKDNAAQPGNAMQLAQQPERMDMSKLEDQAGYLHQMLNSVLQKDKHYGVIPGCGKKPTLLKPGAEKLCLAFRLAPSYKVNMGDLQNGHREYDVVCTLTHINTGQVLGQGLGSCSTMERKYRYKNEWVNGAKVKVENDDIADYYNTCLKMAKKRALVDVCLTATAASDIFTQDIEDMKEVLWDGKAPGKFTKTEPRQAEIDDIPIDVETQPVEPEPEEKPKRAWKISEGQRKRMWAIIKGHGFDDSVCQQILKQVIQQEAGVDSSNDIGTKTAYDSICKRLESKDFEVIL